MLNYKEPAIEDTEGVLVIYGNDYKVLQYIKFDSDFNNLITSLQMDDYTELYFDIMKFMHSLHIEPKFCSEDYFDQSYINFDDIFNSYMKNITEPDYFFYGEITLAAFQLGVILGIQIEKLGQLRHEQFLQRLREAEEKARAEAEGQPSDPKEKSVLDQTLES